VSQRLQLKSYRFRAEREWDWRRLERLLEKMEKGSPANLSDDELLAVPVLYRAALSSLSVARATSLDKSLIDYLESLCARAYFFVYGARSTLWERLSGFFAHAWPRAVQSLWRETLVSAAIFLLAAVAAFILVGQDPDWFYAVLPPEMAGGRDPTATTEDLRATLGGVKDEPLSAFAAFLFTHNAQIAILAFALGFAFCIPTVLLMAYNGLMLGAFMALFVSRGLGIEAGGWLLIHGVTELLAVILAGAAGLRIGWTLAMPGDRPRLDALADAGRTAATAMGGVIVMLMIAGLIEGFGRQLIESTPIRYGIAAGSAVIWLAYFYLPRGGAPRGR
jgi:uncharacterized membrane protein SpoIIM required for sporulation